MPIGPRYRAKERPYFLQVANDPKMVFMRRSEIMSDSLSLPIRPRPYQYCHHIKLDDSPDVSFIDRRNGLLWSASPGHIDCIDFALLCVFRTISSAITDVSFKLSTLEFQKNNNFNLLVFLFELDETIAALLNPTNLFSYGGFKWGIMPFVSDVLSVIDSFRDVLGRIGNNLSRRRVVVKRDISGFYRYGGTSFDVDLNIRGSGFLQPQSLDLDHFDLARIFLDEIGLHFNLATLWDMIPLSFMLNQYISIGDSLEAIHPSQWFRPVMDFDGGVTIKGVVRVNGLPFDFATSPHIFHVRSGGQSTFNVFVRQPLAFSSDKLEKDVEWREPPASRTFDTAYIGYGLAREPVNDRIESYRRRLVKSKGDPSGKLLRKLGLPRLPF